MIPAEKAELRRPPSGMPPGWYGEPVKIGEHMPHDGGHMRSRSIPDDRRAPPRLAPEALQSRPRKSAQSPPRTTETPAGTLQKIPPEAAASGGKLFFCVWLQNAPLPGI